MLVTATDAADARAVLERGDILLYPDGGFDIPASVRAALMGVKQDGRSFHKNLAYKPNTDRISGVGYGADAPAILAAMREYSRSALAFMRRIVPEYARSWKVDYASFRSIEERGRNLPLTKRNDLLHVDAFPTRPVFGDMILRCFTNVNPSQPREWLTSDPFRTLANEQAANAGIEKYGNTGGLGRSIAKILRKAGIPVADRSPYDAFMLHFHDWLKANDAYQRNCPKYRFDLPPGSTWLVFTDLVPHAVLGGRLALEQTVIVSRDSLADRASAPASILEEMTGRVLTA